MALKIKVKNVHGSICCCCLNYKGFLLFLVYVTGCASMFACMCINVNIYLTRSVYFCLLFFLFSIQQNCLKKTTRIARILIFIQAAVKGSKLNKKKKKYYNTNTKNQHSFYNHNTFTCCVNVKYPQPLPVMISSSFLNFAKYFSFLFLLWTFFFWFFLNFSFISFVFCFYSFLLFLLHF